MYKDILIISDNPNLCQKFEKIIRRLEFSSLRWDFGISPFSSFHEFEKKVQSKIIIYDLKKREVVEDIIAEYDLVFSIHCKQIFPIRLVDNVKCINIHPGYNPINRGWYPQVFAIINDLPIGATIHEIDRKLDHGNIIARDLVEKSITDTSEKLYEKILTKELELLEKNLSKIIQNDYETFKPESEGNLFLKKDYNALKELDPCEKMSTLDFVNRIRALTHGNYENAYFVDPKTKKKVFITINLEIKD